MGQQLSEKINDTEIQEALRYFKSQNTPHPGDKTSLEDFDPTPNVGCSGKSLIDTVQMATKQFISNPLNLTKKTIDLFFDMQDILLQKSELAADNKDRRFADASWRENLFYRAWLQGYLGWKKQLTTWADDEDFSSADRKRVKFIIDLLSDALSPSNSLLNPSAVKKFFETGGTSVFRGTKNFINDIVSNSGMPSQVDKTKFELGKNLAMTPGSVVYRDEVLELIHYKPQKKQVLERPIFIIPPQINKYYVLDLSENKSVVRFLLSQGLQVFIVSWRNPSPKEYYWGIEDYIVALDKAIDASLDITQSKCVNAIAACTGGITALTMLGYYSALKIEKIKSLTMLVSLYDMDMNSDSMISLFANEKSIEKARKKSSKQGVLKGSEMARMFSWMRPNDLIWNYWVNNYLLGEDPPSFDILFWNADTTQLTASFHSQVLDLLSKNYLVRPGKMTILGEKIDLGKITTKIFSVAGTTDHICPWKGCYKSASHVGNDNDNVFILSQSGHMQCILSLPGNAKSSYYKNDTTPENPEKWIESAKVVQASWWEYWVEWVSKHSGDMKPATAKLGNENYPPIMDAPGKYVLE